MLRVFGLLKVAFVIGIDFAMIYYAFRSVEIAATCATLIFLYVWLGGYLSLLKEGAVNAKKLPTYEKNRLDMVRTRLVEDVKNTSGVNVSGISLYLVPDDDTMNATAYGANCISVTRGTLNNADPITLNAVLSHEISHILNYDSCI